MLYVENRKDYRIGGKFIKKKILLIIVIMFSFFKTFPIKADNKYQLKKENYDNIYYVQNGLPDFYGSDIQFKLSINGLTAFCVNPNYGINTYEYFGKPLTQTDYDSATQNYLNKIIYYGYDYPTHQTAQYYMATQALIWEKVSPYLIEFYTQRYGYGDYIDISNEKQEILNLVQNHNRIPDFANQTFTYDQADSLEYESDILNQYQIAATTWEDVKIENNVLKVNNLSKFNGTIEISFKKNFYRNDEAMYYYAENSQSVITGGKLNDINFNLTLKIGADNIVKVNTEDNNQNGKIEITKIDSETKNPIPFVGFSIYAKEDIVTSDGVIKFTKDDWVASKTTDFDGIASFSDLYIGKYYVKETRNKSDYIPNETIYNADLTENNFQKITVENELKKIDISLTKYGEKYNYKLGETSLKLLEGVEYTLYANEDIITSDYTTHYLKGDVVDTLKTNSSGKITFGNLILGSYCLKETKTLDSYIIDIQEYCFDLEEEKNYNLEITNYLKRFDLKLNKLDSESNLPIKNANIKFTIKNIDTNRYIYINDSKELSINKEGYLLIEDIPYGTYEIIEVFTDSEYKLNEEKQIITVDSETILNNNVYEFNFYNEKEIGEIEIIKIDSETKNSIPFVGFTIYAKEDIVTKDNVMHFKKDEMVASKTTDFDGKAVFTNLILGKYYIKETKTPIDYIQNDVIYEVNLLENSNQQITIENELSKGEINLTKYGENYNYKTSESNFKSLEGIEYTLYANEDIITSDYTTHYLKGDVIETLKTNGNGKIIFDNLILGSYCLKETKTLDNYIIDNQEYCFNLKESAIQNIEITNYLKKFNLKLNKLDSESKLPIKNADIKFTIKNVDTNRYIYIDNSKELSINEHGQLLVENIPFGKYQIKEISTISNYNLNEIPEEIIVNSETELEEGLFELDFYNTQKKGSITLTKFGEVFDFSNLKYNIEKLNNVEFSLYRDNGKEPLISTNKTDENGSIRFDNLAYGKYYLQENSVKEGYIENNNKYYINLKDGSNQNIEITNYLKKTDLKIIKQDSETKEPLEGVVFEIFSDNVSLGKYTTDKNGVIQLTNLPEDTYIIKEIQTKDGYILSSEEKEVNLKLINEVVFENKRKIELPNTLKNNYINIIFSLVFISGLSLLIYDKKKHNKNF